MTSGLPNTAYFKIIDVWLLFFLTTNAIIITLHIIVDVLLRKEKESLTQVKLNVIVVLITLINFSTLQIKFLSPRRINVWAKITFPVIFVTFVLFLAFSVRFRFGVAKPLTK